MKPLIVLSVLTLFIACQPVNRQATHKAHGKLKHIDWLIGRWQMQTSDGIVTEEWVQPSDTELLGISFMVTPEGDTPFAEHIRLSAQDDRLYYIPTVANQNEGKEVSFAEQSFTDSLIIFENKSHDFPQRIFYKRISDTSILAAIEGLRNGQNHREEFTYMRK